MENKTETPNTETQTAPKLGRNDPCHCGSGKKYKKCHALLETPVTPSAASNAADETQAPAMPGGLDPSQFDPAMMAQVSQMLSRMPKGQLLKMQALMSKAMAGKDISREANDFEKTLPTELQQLLLNMPKGAEDEAAKVFPNQDEPKKESRFSKVWGSLTGKK